MNSIYVIKNTLYTVYIKFEQILLKNLLWDTGHACNIYRYIHTYGIGQMQWMQINDRVFWADVNKYSQFHQNLVLVGPMLQSGSPPMYHSIPTASNSISKGIILTKCKQNSSRYTKINFVADDDGSVSLKSVPVPN